MKIKLTGGLLLLGVAMFLAMAPQGFAVSACVSARFNDYKDLGVCKIPTTTQKGKCPDCDGMPRWWVTEPYINLWMADQPLSYTTSNGQKMEFRWTYTQRGQLTGALRSRELIGADDPPMRFREGVASGAGIMTNASWCHNWWSEIVLWDTYVEAKAVSINNVYN